MILQKCAYCRGEGTVQCPHCVGADSSLFPDLDSEWDGKNLGNLTTEVPVCKSPKGEGTIAGQSICSVCGGKKRVTCPGCLGSGIVEMPAWA